ncbi:MAG TPA: glycine cleavage system protein GcvH [Pirellulales bacterium]|nr:glycine cleavage system protein GcvH [Pirellulales bacterium]
MNPEQLRFAKTHEWVHVEPDSQGQQVATLGVSSFAVEALTDLVFMQLPEVGRQVKPGQSVGEIESVKAVSDLYSPVGGKVVAVNTDLPNHLETLSSDPYGAGWMVKIQLDDPKQLDSLMDYATYQAQCAEEGH